MVPPPDVAGAAPSPYSAELPGIENFIVPPDVPDGAAATAVETSIGDLHAGQLACFPEALSRAKSAADIEPVLPHAEHLMRTRSSRATTPSAAATIALASSAQLA